MSIYIASRKLKSDSKLNIKLLNNKIIQEVTKQDIFISQGTLRDDLMLRILIDRGVLPFIVSYSKTSTLSILLSHLSLHIPKKIAIITKETIEEVEKLQNNFTQFDTHSTAILEEGNALKKLASLFFYQQVQLFNFSQNALKSEKVLKIEKRRNIYIDKKKIFKGRIKIYLILEDEHQLRILKLEGESKEKDEEFIRNKVNNNFESIMQGEKISFKNRKFSFTSEEISSKYKKDFLLFGIEDIQSFKSYQIYDITSKKEFNYIALYEIEKMVQPLNEKGILALTSLKSILNNQIAETINLDTFLRSTLAFKKVIPSVHYKYQDHLIKTIISDMLSKIYNNIIEEKYKKSNLRYALVLLQNQSVELMNQNLQAHIFYDIQKGVNVQKLILQEQMDSIKKNDSQITTIEEEILVDPKESEIQDFINNQDVRNFIKLFLNTLLAMDSVKNIDREKTIQFIAFFAYLSFGVEFNKNNKNNKENFQIDHCYIMFVENQIKNNKNIFFEYLDEFVNEAIYPKSIEVYLEKYIYYTCTTHHSKEITLHIGKEGIIEKKENLRQQNSRFSKKIIIVGLFYQAITQEKDLDNIILTLFKKIKNKTISIPTHCQKKISFKFLALFFQGHGKKDCHSNLQAFFEEANYFLKES